MSALWLLAILTCGALAGLATVQLLDGIDIWVERRAERRAVREFEAMRREVGRG